MVAEQIIVTDGQTRLLDLPGGSKVAKRVSSMHPSAINVRSVIQTVEKESADNEHARDLLEALVSDTSYIPPNVRPKLQSILDAGVLDDILLPATRPLLSRLTRGCVGK